MGRGIDPVHPSVCPSVLRPSIVVLVRSAPLCSAQSPAEEIKFSAGDLFPFSCQRSTASRSRASGDPTVTDGRAERRPARPFRSSLHENQLLRSAKEKRFI